MGIFRKLLVPNAVYEKLENVSFEDLRDQGFRVALLDLDNTLAEDHVHEPSPYTMDMIGRLQSAGFTCCIVSNAKSTRSADFAALIPVACISYANKPAPSGIFKALDLLDARKEEAVFFGDQIFTDIVAANRAGIHAILVEPFPGKEVFYVRLKRPLEKLVRAIFKF